MSGLRHAALLVRPTVRSASWAPLAGAGALALAILALGDPGVGRLRLAAIALCVGAAFVLDDAAAATVASAPTPLWARRSLRVALALVPLAALWALVWWLADGASWALSLELGAMLALTLAAAALAAQIRGDGRGGVAAGPALLALLAAAYLLLPARFGFFPADPEDPLWGPAHERWALVLLAGLLGLLLASRDPAAASRIPRLHRAPDPRPETRSS